MIDTDTQLPTIEQAQEFLRLVNVGRKAANLRPLEYLDFDNAESNHCENCLSARNLFCAEGLNNGNGLEVLETYTYTDPRIANALGMEPHTSTTYEIPDSILAVTDPFDNEVPGLRERLAEAGVVK